MKTYLEKVSALLLMFILLSAAVAYSGKLWGYDLLHVANSSTKETETTPPSEAELAQLGYPQGGLVLIKTGIWSVTAANNRKGIIIHSLPFSPKLFGYAGSVPLYIAVGEDNKIEKVIVSKNDETPSFVKKVLKTGILSSWNGKTISQAAELEVDAVSGATYTSTAIAKGVKAALASVAGDSLTTSKKPASGLHKTVGVLLVLATGVALAFIKPKNQKFRIVQQLLNIGVLGFWGAHFLSLGLLTGWLANGVDVITLLPMVIMVALAFLLPLFGKRNYYCTWVCPLGAAQELMGKTNKRKLTISPKVMKYLKYSRQTLFMLLLFTMWLDLGMEIIQYEPFSAFLVTSASHVVLGLAVVILILSLFINRPWCRFVCPTGQLLSWSEGLK